MIKFKKTVLAVALSAAVAPGVASAQNAAADADTIVATVGYALTAYVENLVLQCTTNCGGTGNSLANLIQDQNAGVVPNTLTGNDGNDTMDGGNGADTLNGGNGADTLDGEEDNDTVNGDAGNDVVSGGPGNDVVDGGADVDSVYGNHGADTIRGGAGADSLWGGGGPDNISGAEASPVDTSNDTLWGNGGADTMYGYGGNDTLWGGTANDTLWGGAGNDVLRPGDGTDQANGEAGDDTLWVEFGYGGDTLNGGTHTTLDKVYLNVDSSNTQVVVNKGTAGDGNGTIVFTDTQGVAHTYTLTGIETVDFATGTDVTSF